MEIRLWSVVAEPVALAAAGPGAEQGGGAGTSFAAGPDAVVVIVEGGVRTNEDVTVPGPLPRRLERHLTHGERPVLVFARLKEGCLALGAARVTRLAHRRGAVQDLGFGLDAPLPYDLLDRVRPTGPPGPQPSADWVNLLPADPGGALEQFIAGWYADVPTVPAEIVAKGPLEVFHRAAAGRAEVYGGSLPIFEAEPAGNGLITFGQAGDGTFTLLSDAEERVFYHGLSDQPLKERERLTPYLLLAALTHAAMDSSPGGMAFVDKAQARRIVGPLRRVPLRPMRWPCARSRFYVGPGVVTLVGEDDGDWYEVYVGARHRSLLRRLRKLGLDWESFDG
ncbi:hypothetical protein ACTI_01430 [Actinoplanes sp. OR16]|uniref:hypothetical protein n=1 Tax=Actinoplanes sp. OR16 TaxID=946334 RepID=UPI000F701F61|nr:hypothetical protein [Actinoplanes sp. OR16]BBH63458.1 hypothetical protein ACTI_01430 [Actinoplanes sp. OR16]